MMRRSEFMCRHGRSSIRFGTRGSPDDGSESAGEVVMAVLIVTPASSLWIARGSGRMA